MRFRVGAGYSAMQLCVGSTGRHSRAAAHSRRRESTFAPLAPRAEPDRLSQRSERFDTPMRPLAAPTQVRIVAAFFALEGVGSIVRMIVGVFRDEYILDFGVVGLLIASGLMALNNTSRIVAVVSLWIGMVACVAVAVLLSMHSGPITWRIAGVDMGDASRSQAYAVVIATFLLMAWMNWTLNRSHIRASFVGKGAGDSTAAGAPSAEGRE